jgi:pentose-5-phosphate-3-epimerase
MIGLVLGLRLGKAPSLRPHTLEDRMATCRECENEVDTLMSVKVGGKARKMCEDCADRARETEEIAEQSESVVQNMMGFKGRR